MIAQAEALLRWIGAAAGMGTLSLALLAMALSFRRRRDRAEGRAGALLRFPFLAAASMAFLAAGLVDYKICLIDATWSALLFRRRSQPRRSRS